MVLDTHPNAPASHEPGIAGDPDLERRRAAEPRAFRPGLPATCLLIALTSCPITLVFAAEPDAAGVFETAGVRRGLVVVVGDSVDLALAMARAEPVVVHVVAPAPRVAALREKVVAAGVHGQVTVSPIDAGGRVNVADGVAGIVIAGASASSPAKAELLRVLRFGGRLLLRRGGAWQAETKPRPDDIDDWPQYFHDAANTDLSRDRRAGCACGLQWQAGPHHKTKIGVRVIGHTWLGVDERGLVARDARSGLPLWRRRDIDIENRYTFLADAERVYYHPPTKTWHPPAPHMIVLDLATGKTIRELTEGVALATEGWVRGTHDWGSFRKAFPKDWKNRFRRAADKADTLQARLADGILVQVATGQMVALDVETGKRLWCVEAGGKDPWHHPLIRDGKVYVVAGEGARSWSYTHWPMGAVRSVHALDLKTGKRLWRWDAPADLGEGGVAAYNMICSDRWLAMAVRTRVDAKSAAAILLVDRATGASHRLVTETTYGTKSVGGGHSHLRLLVAGGKLWINSAIGQHGGADPADPGDKKQWVQPYNKLPRPVGCTVWRATPTWMLGSLSAYSLHGSTIHHTNAARTACDVGAFPAAGLTYITPNHCFCQPYLPGFNAFHPRPFAGSEELERLQSGPAKVPAIRADASGHAGANSPTKDGWPACYAHADRGSWTTAPLGGPLTRRWSVRLAEPVPAESLLADEWAGQWYTQGPVTGVSAAEGTLVCALTDRQQIVALAPATGTVRWRRTVDGRVDSSPTIRAGLVYAGTRNGWVYALARETGEVAWRFFAAPRRQRIVVCGQLESPWPVHGAVLVDDDGVWAVAGRHNDADGGLWWWRLDGRTGKPLAQGRLGTDRLRTVPGGGVAPGRGPADVPNGANTPAVSDGTLVLLAGMWLKKQGGRLVLWQGLRAKDEHERWTVRFPLDILVPGNQGLLNRTETLGGYKMSYFGLTQAPFFAYHGRDFVSVNGTTTIQHRGGGLDRRSTVRRFRKHETIQHVSNPRRKRPTPQGGRIIWETPCKEADKAGVKALAVAGESVLIGFSVENRDHWRDAKKMPHRLRVLDLATGKPRQADLPLPAPPVQAGLAAAAGQAYAVTRDGTVTCFAERP